MLDFIFGLITGITLVVIIWSTCVQFRKDDFQKTGYEMWKTAEAVKVFTSDKNPEYHFRYLNKQFTVKVERVETGLSYNNSYTYKITINNIEIAFLNKLVSEGLTDYFSLCIAPKYKKTEVIDLFKALKKDIDRQKIWDNVTSQKSIFE